jgi:hypothetical protein
VTYASGKHPSLKINEMSEFFASISGAMCDCAGGSAGGGGGWAGPRGVLSSPAATGLLLSYGVHTSLAAPSVAAAAPTIAAAAASTITAAAAPTNSAAAASATAAAAYMDEGVAGACPSSDVSLTGASCVWPAVDGVGTEPSSAGPMKEAPPVQPMITKSVADPDPGSGALLTQDPE